MTSDMQPIAFNAILPISDVALASPFDSSVGHTGYPDCETLSAAIRRVDLDDEDEFDDDEEDDFEEDEDDEHEEDDDEEEDEDDEYDDDEDEDEEDEEDEDEDEDEEDDEEDELNLI